MSSFEEVAKACREVVGLTSDLSTHLRLVADDGAEIAADLRQVLAGTSQSDAEQVIGCFAEVEDGAARLVALVSAAGEAVARIVHNLLGFTTDGVPVYPVPVPSEPFTLPDYPLRDQLHTHIFEGHRQGRKIKGYHRHTTASGKELVDEKPRDPHDVYEARVREPLADGGVATKLRSSFFPDNWTPEEVAHAARAAFAARTRVIGASGQPKLSLWEGRYRGIRIQGFVTPGTDLATARFDDVHTAWPLYEPR